jgi:hypothetical protein
MRFRMRLMFALVLLTMVGFSAALMPAAARTGRAITLDCNASGIDPCQRTVGPCTLSVWKPWHIAVNGNDKIRLHSRLACSTSQARLELQGYLYRYNCVMYTRGISCGDPTQLDSGSMFDTCGDPVYPDADSCTSPGDGKYTSVEDFGTYDPVDNPTVCHGWQNQSDASFKKYGYSQWQNISITTSKPLYWGPNTYDPC